MVLNTYLGWMNTEFPGQSLTEGKNGGLGQGEKKELGSWPYTAFTESDAQDRIE